MFNMKHMKIAIFALTVSILGTSALIVNSGNMAYAQGNNTQGDVTKTIDADSLIKALKARHPVLAQLVTNEDKDLVVKFKDLDTKEALKTALALNMLHLLQQYREIDQPQ
jgi:fructose-1,6-bisphosphatase